MNIIDKLLNNCDVFIYQLKTQPNDYTNIQNNFLQIIGCLSNILSDDNSIWLNDEHFILRVENTLIKLDTIVNIGSILFSSKDQETQIVNSLLNTCVTFIKKLRKIIENYQCQIPNKSLLTKHFLNESIVLLKDIQKLSDKYIFDINIAQQVVKNFILLTNYYLIVFEQILNNQECNLLLTNILEVALLVFQYFYTLFQNSNSTIAKQLLINIDQLMNNIKNFMKNCHIELKQRSKKCNVSGDITTSNCKSVPVDLLYIIIQELCKSMKLLIFYENVKGRRRSLIEKHLVQLFTIFLTMISSSNSKYICLSQKILYVKLCQRLLTCTIKINRNTHQAMNSMRNEETILVYSDSEIFDLLLFIQQTLTHLHYIVLSLFSMEDNRLILMLNLYSKRLIFVQQTIHNCLNQFSYHRQQTSITLNNTLSYETDTQTKLTGKLFYVITY
ncbi:unnamed protein product [Didymodactylos carnosus]|uniref:Uncharacterized protein n=1 Tax=Didymodactylos carnosus TaxID=1234261 RepID=A0A8S2F6D0_9BILA|nr:unnamed protein product [Didymodactylos carnosus]CAF4168150.1 unnamed protein product [Didymodactylos carnosus]